MARTFRALIIDDDILATRMLEARLLDALPELDVDSTTEPDAVGDYDLYFVDNDFDGQILGPTLARTIRADQPNALIIAFSGTLTHDTLKGFLNAGCDGACDKSNPGDLDTVLDISRKFIGEAQARSSEVRGLRGILNSMTSLLREWNQRLDHMERI